MCFPGARMPHSLWLKFFPVIQIILITKMRLIYKNLTTRSDLHSSDFTSLFPVCSLNRYLVREHNTKVSCLCNSSLFITSQGVNWLPQTIRNGKYWSWDNHTPLHGNCTHLAKVNPAAFCTNSYQRQMCPQSIFEFHDASDPSKQI